MQNVKTRSNKFNNMRQGWGTWGTLRIIHRAYFQRPINVITG